MKIRYWLHSGANIHSKYEGVMDLEDVAMTVEEWEAMEEIEKDEMMKEYCFEQAEWGYAPEVPDELK